MNSFLFYLCEFVIAFVLVYLFYYIVVITKMKDSKNDKKTKKNKKDSFTEIKLFLKINNIDERTVDKVKLMNTLAIVNGIDIGIILLATEITSSFALKLLIAFILIFVIMIASYKFLGMFYKKKGN